MVDAGRIGSESNAVDRSPYRSNSDGRARRGRQPAMKIIVDYDRCEGYGRCVEIAPEIFALNDDGQSYVVAERLEAEMRPQIEQAVRLCPRQALALVDDDSAR
jgi:ferredoxin